MEILKHSIWFIYGVLFASIGWGFITLIIFNMYLSAERKYKDLRNKALKEIKALRKGGLQ